VDPDHHSASGLLRRLQLQLRQRLRQQLWLRLLISFPKTVQEKSCTVSFFAVIALSVVCDFIASVV